jgi:aryl-alcohol dehydrogenase-like predicted oxidoreductase
MKSNATAQATRDHLAASRETASGLLGSTGLTVSQAGFGCYRIEPQVPEHGYALKQALMNGVNLIDTSSNYADGGSEVLVGRVLDELVNDGLLKREQVVVVTKAGYLQGSNYAGSQERKQRGQPWPELVEYAPNLEHCLHPDFLDDQLSASLERLGLKAVDVYLLHNPEYYLGWAAKQGISLEQAREEYYRRIEAAFRHLESEADAGRISFYGVSSNTFPAPDEYEEFTSLDRLWQIAQSISDQHCFRVIEMPFNLLEPDAATETNQPGGKSVLAYAHEKGLGVLINRPLNAIGPNGLFRLAMSGSDKQSPAPEMVIELLNELLKSEDVLKLNLLPNLRLTPDENQQVSEYLSVAGQLLRSWQGLSGLEHWRQMEQYLTARLNAAFAYLARRMAESPEGLSALDAHLDKAKLALEAVLQFYAVEADQFASKLYDMVRGLDSDWKDAASLSRLAIRALRSSQGVSCVLVGMRRSEYVADVLAELANDVAMKPREETWLSWAGSDPEKPEA